MFAQKPDNSLKVEDIQSLSEGAEYFIHNPHKDLWAKRTFCPNGTNITSLTRKIEEGNVYVSNPGTVNEG